MAQKHWVAAENRALAAREIGRLTADRYRADHVRVREVLRALAVIFPGPVALAAQHHNTLWAQTSVRLQGASDRARRVVADLERPLQPLVAIDAGARLRDEAHASLSGIVHAVDARDHTEREHRERGAEAEVVRQLLREKLKELKAAWGAARRLSGSVIPDLFYEVVAADAARREAEAARRRGAKVTPPPPDPCIDLP